MIKLPSRFKRSFEIDAGIPKYREDTPHIHAFMIILSTYHITYPVYMLYMHDIYPYIFTYLYIYIMYIYYIMNVYYIYYIY